MIYSIYGFGKVKTEASIGLAIRSIANSDEVIYSQFLKDNSSGECGVLRKLGVEVISTRTNGLVYNEDDIQDCKNLLKFLFNQYPDLIIADEILVAYDLGFLTFKDIRSLVDNCNARGIDLCMTGRIISKDKRNNINSLSDIVTNAYAVKHWFNTYCPDCKCEYEYYYKYCPKCGRELKESKPSKRGRDF
jgi:ATP:corrinoid adenosyltransferase